MMHTHNFVYVLALLKTDLALVAFYSDFMFQYIDPYNDFYFSNCRVIDYFCDGVHLMNVSTLPMVQTSITIWRSLSTNGEVGCGQHCASSFGVDHSCNPSEFHVHTYILWFAKWCFVWFSIHSQQIQ